MFYQTNARRPPKSPPAAMEWFRPLLHDDICSERVTMRYAAERIIHLLSGVMGVHSALFVPGDLDIQTRWSEGPNTYTL